MFGYEQQPFVYSLSVFTCDFPLPLGSIEPTPKEADIGGQVTHNRTGITPVLKLSDTDS